MSEETLGTHVLCLHYLRRQGERPRRLALERSAFEALLDRQLALGRRPVSLDSAELGAAGTFALSFDDAHRSVLTEALPVLRARGLTATLFVPTAWVGTSDEWLTWAELRELHREGWTLGSHTQKHQRMRWRLYDETQRQYEGRLLEECVRSKRELEARLGAAVRLFAYPYGEAPEEAREACRAAGYARAFTVAGDCRWDGDPLRIPRVDALEDGGLVAPVSEEPTRYSVVIPACDRPALLREVVRRLAQQSYPEERFEVLVVDDGSKEDLRSALGEVPRNFTLLPGGEAGVFRAGQARQRGADAARFEHLLFLDADVVVGRDFLWHLDWVHRRDPGTVLLGYLSGYNLHDLGHLHTLPQVLGVEDPERELPVLPDRSREVALRRCLDNLDWLEEPWRLCYSGNLSMPAELLRRVGGFARDFTGWGLEDLELGYRLSGAGARWTFSRFAVGYHLVDPGEDSPRNPFRAPLPARPRFEGYLRNLDTLVSRAPSDPALLRYREQTLADIEETCSRPATVGLELGGACSLECAFHRSLHGCQPGGVGAEEALDRVAYARKVGARALYVLGGETASHPALPELLATAREASLRVMLETPLFALASAGLASRLREQGLSHVVLEVLAGDDALLAELTGAADCGARQRAGLEALVASGLSRSACVVVAPRGESALASALALLAAHGVRVEELRLLEGAEVGTCATALASAGVGAPIRRVEPGPR